MLPLPSHPPTRPPHCRLAPHTRWISALAILIAALFFGSRALADQPYGSTQSQGDWNPKQQFLDSLPPSISDGLDINGWGWFSYLHNSKPKSDFTDTVLSLDITKSFAQRVALTFEGNLIDADGQWRAEAEQLYLSVRPLDDYAGYVTLGKFNANFGLEERDFWDRTHGTTSLLFGAQPQDLVGLIASLPLGSTGVTLRPFIGLDFQGQFEYNQPPLAGMQILYKPTSELQLSWTNLAGPGMTVYEGAPIRHPYPQGGYGGSAAAIENWQGPNLYADRGGTLYFTDANVAWRPRNDLMLGAEGLLATTGTDEGHVGWSGAMLTADFKVTDKFHLFGRASYLNDDDWLVYGVFQKMYEYSVGAGYQLFDKVELRGEYRHDHGSVTGNSDTFSIHITAGF